MTRTRHPASRGAAPDGITQGGGRVSWGPGLVVFVLLGIAVALMDTATTPGFDPTGMIYIDIARHIANGDGIAASILFPSHVPKMPSPISLPPVTEIAATALSENLFVMLVLLSILSI